MRTLSRLGGFLGWSLGLLGGFSSSAAVAAGADEAPSLGEPNRVSLVRRSARQDQGGWIVDYRIRNETGSGIVIVPSELEATSEGWVSNSRVGGHSVPRRAVATRRGDSKAKDAGVAEVIASPDGAPICRERLTLSIQADDALAIASPPQSVVEPISLAPGASGLLRLRFEHEHAPAGAYDPLLGERTVALRVGGETFHDVAPLDREQYLAQPRFQWPEIPEDRRDSSRYVSAPDSLHLRADVVDRRFYRFPDRPARYSSRMRLSFWYLIAQGALGECRVRLTQSNERSLRGGGFDEELTTIGRWTRVEWLVPIEYDAVSVGLDFRIVSEAGVGEMWIDDVELEPVDPASLANKGP